MRLAAISPASKRIPAGALASVLMASAIAVVPLFANQMVALDKTKSMAETQHEIVMLLIKQKDYQKAVAEANKIFEMKWPEDQEPLLLKELLYLSEQFLLNDQALLGMQFIEKSSKCFKKIPSQVAILKERGYLYKKMGQNEKALDCFRKAQELEDQK